jgi:hypothetical protein
LRFEPEAQSGRALAARKTGLSKARGERRKHLRWKSPGLRAARAPVRSRFCARRCSAGCLGQVRAGWRGWVILTGASQQYACEIYFGFGWLCVRAVGRAAGASLNLFGAGLPFACVLGNLGSSFHGKGVLQANSWVRINPTTK